MAEIPVCTCDGVKVKTKQIILHKVCHRSVKVWPNLCYIYSPVLSMLFAVLMLRKSKILRCPTGHSSKLSFNTGRDI